MSLFSRNPRRRIYRFRRNPEGGSGAFSWKEISGDIGPAVIGAGGALVVDWIFGNIPLPPTLTTGIMLPVSRLGAAIAVGAVGGMIAGRATGEKIMLGALVVTSYSIIKNFLVTNVPSLTLAGMPMGRFVRGPVRLRGLGYASPARVPGMGRIRSLPTPQMGVNATMGRFVRNR